MKDLIIWGNPFLKKFELNDSLVKKDLEDEYDSYLKVKEWFNGRRIKKKKLVFYYPGFGGDMLNILAMYDALVSDNNKIVEFILVDITDSHNDVVAGLKQYTKGVKVVEKKINGKYVITAYFKDKEFRIICHIADAVNFIPPELSKIDLYYERAFELFRSYNDLLLNKLCSLVNKGGLMITDSGFDFGNFSSKLF